MTYDPDDDKKYHSHMMAIMQKEKKTLACMVKILLENDGHPITHVNGMEWGKAMEMVNVLVKS